MAQRRFEANGVEWIVYDVAAAGDLRSNFRSIATSSTSDAPFVVGVTTWLCFETLGVDAQKRRLSPVPAGWPNLSEDELCRLLLIAQPALR